MRLFDDTGLAWGASATAAFSKNRMAAGEKAL
jgi:hypothetical protein